MNELKHFGVKGMRWGVRHERERNGSENRPQLSKEEKAARRKQRLQKGLGIVSGLAGAGLVAYSVATGDYGSAIGAGQRFIQSLMGMGSAKGGRPVKTISGLRSVKAGDLANDPTTKAIYSAYRNAMYAYNESVGRDVVGFGPKWKR